MQNQKTSAPHFVVFFALLCLPLAAGNQDSLTLWDVTRDKRLEDVKPMQGLYTLAFSPKKITTGRYFILARADGGNAVIETNEANNIRPTLAPLIIRKEKK